MPTKVCRKCEVEKDTSAFSRHANTRDGLKSWCKPCLVESAQASGVRNPEKVRGHKRAWKKRNPDKIREQQRKAYPRLYERNAPKIRAWSRAWAAKNKDKIKARYTSPRGRMLRRINQARRNGRIANAPSDLTPEAWLGVLDRFDHRCAYCGDPWQEIDHIIPVSKGGGLVIGNVVPACKSCNVAKNARSIYDFCLDRGWDHVDWIVSLAA